METKPKTLWAIVSLVGSSFGCLLFLALIPLGEEYGQIANRSASVGAIWMVLHILVAIAFCLLGTVCGIIALLRINTGRFVGWKKAWTGILLGVLPFVLFVMFMILTPGNRPDFLR
jgi:hypothetical protein